MSRRERAAGVPRARTVVALLVAVAAVAAASSSSAPHAGGTLNLLGTLPVLSLEVVCPPGGTPEPDDCRARSGKALVRGLGLVSETFTWSYRMGPPACPSGLGKPLATTGRLAVAGKGAILFALADGARCIEQLPLRNEPQSFTITGGTGVYEGASGSGRVERSISSGSGTETWKGTLVVPGLEFDVTPPTLSGAVSKTVRAAKGASSVRVTYRVAATDALDGRLPTTCRPQSGSRFRVGRTVVRCSATDRSGNTGRSAFRVTVSRAG